MNDVWRLILKQYLDPKDAFSLMHSSRYFYYLLGWREKLRLRIGQADEEAFCCTCRKDEKVASDIQPWVLVHNCWIDCDLCNTRFMAYGDADDTVWRARHDCCLECRVLCNGCSGLTYECPDCSFVFPASEERLHQASGHCRAPNLWQRLSSYLMWTSVAPMDMERLEGLEHMYELARRYPNRRVQLYCLKKYLKK